MKIIIFISAITVIHSQLQVFNPRFRRQQESSATLWPNGIVYYYFDEGAASQDEDFKDYTRDAMNLISEVSCIQFVEDDSKHHVLRIIREKECSSEVGMSQSGEQIVHLSPDCHEMEAVHEFFHVLGFMHTHQRSDRDEYVTVHLNNVEKDEKEQLTVYKKSEWKDIGIPYDFGSIMHYGSKFFSSNDKHTIVPVNEDYLQTIGSRKMSYYDIKMVNDVYECDAKCKGKNRGCQNYGFPNPNDCEECICPHGYGGSTCEDRSNDGCGATFSAGPEWARQVLITNFNDEQIFDRPHYCNYWIEAPEGTKVEVKIMQLDNFTCAEGCDSNFIEIKTDLDPRESYPRFCCSDELDTNNVIDSVNPTVIVMANMKTFHTYAHVEYRYVDTEEETTTEAAEEETTVVEEEIATEEPEEQFRRSFGRS